MSGSIDKNAISYNIFFGIHSYLTYLRDRMIVERDLLKESGCIIVQIGDENVHRIRELMSEIFGPDNYVATISFTKTSGQTKTNFSL